MYSKLVLLLSLISLVSFADVADDWYAGMMKIKKAGIQSFKRPSDKDQLTLRYVYLQAERREGEKQKGIVISPGYGENFYKYSSISEEFLREGFDVFIINHRGMGYSDRYEKLEDMDYTLHRQTVHIESFDDYVKDFIYFVKNIIPASHNYKGELHMFSHSTGGLIAAHAMAREQSMFKTAVLSAPLFGINYSTLSWVAVNIGQTLGLSKRWGPMGTNQTWDPQNAEHDLTKADTSDEFQWQLNTDFFKENPDLAQSVASRGWIQQVEKYSSNAKLKFLAANLRTPTYLFSAGTDNFVNKKRHHLFFKYVMKHNKKMRKKGLSKKLTPVFLHAAGYENAYHCIFRDKAKVSRRQIETVLTIFKK